MARKASVRVPTCWLFGHVYRLSCADTDLVAVYLWVCLDCGQIEPNAKQMPNDYHIEPKDLTE